MELWSKGPIEYPGLPDSNINKCSMSEDNGEHTILFDVTMEDCEAT